MMNFYKKYSENRFHNIRLKIRDETLETRLEKFGLVPKKDNYQIAACYDIDRTEFQQTIKDEIYENIASDTV